MKLLWFWGYTVYLLRACYFSNSICFLGSFGFLELPYLDFLKYLYLDLNVLHTVCCCCWSKQCHTSSNASFLPPCLKAIVHSIVVINSMLRMTHFCFFNKTQRRNSEEFCIRNATKMRGAMQILDLKHENVFSIFWKWIQLKMHFCQSDHNQNIVSMSTFNHFQI